MSLAAGDTRETQAARDLRPHVGFSSPHSAIRYFRCHVWLWGAAAILLIGDLFTKQMAFQNLDRGQSKALIPGLLNLELSLNAGALFGMGTGLVWLFALASVAALGFVVYLFSTSRREQKVVHFALALLLAGALGNLYDRVTEQYDIATLRGSDGVQRIWIGHVLGEANGDADAVEVRSWGSKRRHEIEMDQVVDGFRKSGVVRDFLRFTPEWSGRPIYPWIFNVADAYLVVGVALLLITYFVENRQASRQSRQVQGDGAQDERDGPDRVADA